jgi:uncharacterized protein (DUF1778 family)
MRGRPKKPESEVKSFMLRVRLTEDERTLMGEAAKTKNLDLSTWAREELVKLAKRALGKK